MATQAAASIPFGPLAHLLPAFQSPGGDSLDVLRQTSRAFAEEAQGRPVVLSVDDAHLLDMASAALVHQLAVGRTASILLTVRIGEPAPDPVVALWKDGVAERVDLQPLDDAEISRLLQEVLGGHIGGRTVRQLTRVIGGNVLFLHELILSGLSSGVLSNASGLWRWAGSVVPGVGLAELIEERLRKLAPAERRLLEALALSEPLEADILQRLASADVVRGVEDSGLMTAVESAGRLTVRITHPLYAEVLRERMPRLQARTTLRLLADSLEATQSGQDDDLRVAILRMRGGQQLAPQIAVSSAQRALVLGEYGLVEQLIGAAESDAGFFGRMLLGQALVGQHRDEDAERLLASVEASSDAEAAHLVLLRAVNLVYRLGRLEEAEAVLQEAERTVGDVEFQRLITAARAQILATGSSAVAGLALAKTLIEQRDTDLLTLARAYLAAGYGLSFSGRAEEALRLLDEAYERLGDLDEFESDLGQLLLGARWWALWLAGRWRQAEEGGGPDPVPAPDPGIFAGGDPGSSTSDPGGIPLDGGGCFSPGTLVATGSATHQAICSWPDQPPDRRPVTPGRRRRAGGERWSPDAVLRLSSSAASAA